MNLDRILLVPTKTRYELEIQKYGSEEKARSHFGSAKIWEDIRTGHSIQKANLEKVFQLFPKEKIVDRSLLTEDRIAENNLIVFLGGDNHFTYCSQVVLEYMRNTQDSKLVTGVVLDPSKSTGALLSFNIDTFLESLPELKRDNYLVEHWTTLEAKINNGEILNPHLAIGDYFIGEENRILMSRNRVYLDGEEIFPDKSSGILIATGTATRPRAWYSNIHQCYFDRQDSFSSEEEYARIILTENADKPKATLYKDQKLIIDSYNDNKGTVCPDSHLEHAVDFSIGAQAEIKISDTKLNVLRR